jgi:hypothetical protein
MKRFRENPPMLVRDRLFERGQFLVVLRPLIRTELMLSRHPNGFVCLGCVNDLELPDEGHCRRQQGVALRDMGVLLQESSEDASGGLNVVVVMKFNLKIGADRIVSIAIDLQGHGDLVGVFPALDRVFNRPFGGFFQLGQFHGNS